MTRRAEPTTLFEATKVAFIQPKTAAHLAGVGENQMRAYLASGEIPGARRLHGRVLVATAVFLPWCGVSMEEAWSAEARGEVISLAPQPQGPDSVSDGAAGRRAGAASLVNLDCAKGDNGHDARARRECHRCRDGIPGNG